MDLCNWDVTLAAHKIQLLHAPHMPQWAAAHEHLMANSMRKNQFESSSLVIQRLINLYIINIYVIYAINIYVIFIFMLKILRLIIDTNN